MPLAFIDKTTAAISTLAVAQAKSKLPYIITVVQKSVSSLTVLSIVYQIAFVNISV